jgi:hypothetical protein
MLIGENKSTFPLFDHEMESTVSYKNRLSEQRIAGHGI